MVITVKKKHVQICPICDPWLLRIVDLDEWFGKKPVEVFGDLANSKETVIELEYGGFHKWGYPKWMVYKRKSYKNG